MGNFHYAMKVWKLKDNRLGQDLRGSAVGDGFYFIILDIMIVPVGTCLQFYFYIFAY